LKQQQLGEKMYTRIPLNSFPQYFSAITQPFPPFPTDFPPNFGTFGFHSRKPLVYEAKQFTWENHSTFPANPSRIKADPPKRKT